MHRKRSEILPRTSAQSAEILTFLRFFASELLTLQTVGKQRKVLES
jgi:hypothetical protein